MENKDIISAHKFSANHKAKLINDKKCGCFYCMEIFEPSAIIQWLKDPGETALCPYCGVIL